MSTTINLGPAMAGGRIGRRAASRTADPKAVHDELMLTAAIAGLLLVVIAMSIVGAGVIARPLFMLAAVVIGVATKRRSPWLYLTATLWFWVITSFARRMVEWHSGFITTDFILVTPHIMTMLIVPDLLRTPGLLKRPGVGYALLLTACVLYGLFVSFVRGDILAGIFSATDWVMPLLYLYFFICNAERIDEAEAHIGVFVTTNLMFVISYSLYQYFLMPDWDAQWMVASGMGSIGHPLPMSSRVFGPMANPGILAIWTAICVVWLAHFRTPLLMMMTPFLFLLVMMTMVRSVYGSLSLAIVVGALIGRGGFGRLVTLIFVAGLSAYAGIAVLNPHVIDQIATRLSTFQNLQDDDSAQVRQMIYRETPKLINENPFGVGIGAQGRGNASQNNKEVLSTNIDSGPLSVFLGLGWVAGPLYLFGMVMLQIRALLIARRMRDTPMAATMAAAGIVPLAIFPFINILGLGAVFLWICLGYVLALSIRATGAAAPPPRRVGAPGPRRIVASPVVTRAVTGGHLG
jgi:hypothetical protein